MLIFHSDDCNPGKKVTMVAGKVVCVPCPKGEYQPDRSQTECITCPADKKTTENTGSTKLSQCIGKSENELICLLSRMK